MTIVPVPVQAEPATSAVPAGLNSLYEMVVNGGPMMVPLAFCSVVALAYAVERSVRLRGATLGSSRLGDAIVREAESGGAARALAVCTDSKSALARVIAIGLRRAGGPFLEVEKAVEDAGSREVRRLSANLRPLVVVAMIAPLLGLLGTVWGMIAAFSNLAVDEGLAQPELLASGISEALVTTAAGLAIAIPSQAAYFYYKSKIDAFVRRSEACYARVTEALAVGGGS